MHLNAFDPASKRKARDIFTSPSEFSDSIRRVFKGLVSEDICFFVHDSDDWSIEISCDAPHSTPTSFSIYDLRDGHEVYLRALSGNVGEKFRLMHLAPEQREFNPSLYDKVQDLTDQYVGYRKIRGDGNCYYRAVAFGLLEQLIITGHRDGFQYVHDCFKNLQFADDNLTANLAVLKEKLLAAAGKLLYFVREKYV